MSRIGADRLVEGAAVLVVWALAVVPGLACAGTQSQPTVSESESESEVVERKMSRDDRYGKVLSSYEKLAGIARGSAPEIETLLTIAADLRSELEALAESARHESEPGRSTVAPGGEATPSDEPSSEEAAEARRRATEDRLLTVPIPEADAEPRSLAHVSDERIRESCSEAEGQLTELERLWRVPGSEPAAIEAGLTELGDTLGRMAAPATDY